MTLISLAAVANGDSGDFAHYLRSASGQWRQLTHFEDDVKQIKFGHDGALYLRALKNAPHGKILRLPLAGTDLSKATIAVPEGRDVIEGLEPSAHGLYVSPLDGGPSHLRFHPRAGGKPVEVPILPVSSVSGLHCWNEDDLLFSNTSFLVPAA